MRTADAKKTIRAIGRRIAELRMAKGWSQAKLAEALDISLQGVQRMEQGRANFTVQTLVNVAAKLGCSARDFWDAPATNVERVRLKAKKKNAAKRSRAPRAPSV